MIAIIIGSILLYNYFVYRNGLIIERDQPPFLSGHLVLDEKIDNKTFKFKINDANFHPEPPNLEKNELGMSMRTSYKNGSEEISMIKRYDEEFNETEDFSFTYLDKDSNNLITNGDMVVINVYLDVDQIDGIHFKFHTQDYDGDLSEDDRSEHLP